MKISIKGKYQDCLSFKNFHLLVLDILVCCARLSHLQILTMQLFKCKTIMSNQLPSHNTKDFGKSHVYIMWLDEPMKFVL
jgi:hypothetical protein